MLPAPTGRGCVHEAGHHPGDGAQLQGLQTQQAADAEGGAHDGEAGEAAEARAGEKAAAEASGDQSFGVKGVTVADRCRASVREPGRDDSADGESFTSDNLFCVTYIFSVTFPCLLKIPGIPQQHPPARKRLQRISPLRVGQNPETYPSRGQLAHQHGARAEEGDGEN